jgi:hypothetical protein
VDLLTLPRDPLVEDRFSTGAVCARPALLCVRATARIRCICGYLLKSFAEEA